MSSDLNGVGVCPNANLGDDLGKRLPAKNVYYYRCPDHRRNYVMSFAFCFDREDDVYQFAYCYPYTYSRLQHYLAGLERRNLPYLQREQLGLSVIQSIATPAVERGEVQPRCRRSCAKLTDGDVGTRSAGGSRPGTCPGSVWTTWARGRLHIGQSHGASLHRHRRADAASTTDTRLGSLGVSGVHSRA
ncbi:unnamed protein product [Arctogadus glacialis]